MAKAEFHRVFFALWPEASVARALHAAGATAQRACGGRPMQRDTLHLTLAFLGSVPADRLADATAAAAAVQAEAFDWQVDCLGYWQHNRILWAGGESAALTALAAALAESLRGAGFQLETRPFAAHITLLRNCRCPAVPPLAEAIAWPAREFVLAESRSGEEGSQYDIIGRWPLASADPDGR